jgi:protein-S-isoprenylcysteine O-methyltransferase Ste14
MVFRSLSRLSALIGFLLIPGAWWQFRQGGIAICPTAPTEGLITHGVYRYTRNPMYFGMMLMLLGIAFFFGPLPFYLAAATVFAILNRVFCPHEEQKNCWPTLAGDTRTMRRPFGDDSEPLVLFRQARLTPMSAV